MASWSELTTSRPELASAGRDLLYQHGVGLAYLATVRRDGGPRVHPVSPLLHDGALYTLVIPSPKRRDLLRDGRYALHSFPRPDNEDAFHVTGTAVRVEDGRVLDGLWRRFFDERSHLSPNDHALEEHVAFELHIERCLLTLTSGHGDPRPRHERWSASDASRGEECE